MYWISIPTEQIPIKFVLSGGPWYVQAQAAEAVGKLGMRDDQILERLLEMQEQGLEETNTYSWNVDPKLIAGEALNRLAALDEAK